MRRYSDERMATGIVRNNKIKQCLKYLEPAVIPFACGLQMRVKKG